MPRSGRSRRFPKFHKGQGPLSVVIEHAPAPDAQQRLTRAYELILRAAVRVDGDGEQGEGAGAPIDETGDEDNV